MSPWDNIQVYAATHAVDRYRERIDGGASDWRDVSDEVKAGVPVDDRLSLVMAATGDFGDFRGKFVVKSPRATFVMDTNGRHACVVVTVLTPKMLVKLVD